MNESNAITAAPASTELIDPQTARESAAFELLQRQAKMLASSTLVPKEFQGNIANCGIAINIARRLSCDAFLITQNIDVIHGRPSFRASFLIAMVNASGRFTPLQFKLTETGKPTSKEVKFKVDSQMQTLKYEYTPTTCVAWAKERATGEVIEGPPVSYDMALQEGWVSKAGSKWQSAMRDLMLRYRAAAFFARLYAPDITLGMQTAEEAQDVAPIRDVTPPQASESKLFKAAPQPAAAPVVEASADFNLSDDPPNLRETIEAKFLGTGLTWDDIAAKLKENEVIDVSRECLADCDDDEMQQIANNFAAIVKMGKGGAK